MIVQHHAPLGVWVSVWLPPATLLLLLLCCRVTGCMQGVCCFAPPCLHIQQMPQQPVPVISCLAAAAFFWLCCCSQVAGGCYGCTVPRLLAFTYSRRNSSLCRGHQHTDGSRCGAPGQPCAICPGAVEFATADFGGYDATVHAGASPRGEGGDWQPQPCLVAYVISVMPAMAPLYMKMW